MLSPFDTEDILSPCELPSYELDLGSWTQGLPVDPFADTATVHAKRKAPEVDSCLTWRSVLGDVGELRFLDATQQLIPHVWMEASLDRGVTFDEETRTWLAYRRNHINASCVFRLRRADGIEAVASYVALPSGQVFAVDGLSVAVFGADVTSHMTATLPTKTVEVYQTCAGRAQKSALAPAPLQCNGSVSFPRLHFKNATANNAHPDGTRKGPQQYVALTLVLRVHIGGSAVTGFGLVSPSIVVRSGNPSDYRTGAPPAKRARGAPRAVAPAPTQLDAISDGSGNELDTLAQSARRVSPAPSEATTATRASSIPAGGMSPLSDMPPACTASPPHGGALSPEGALSPSPAADVWEPGMESCAGGVAALPPASPPTATEVEVEPMIDDGPKEAGASHWASGSVPGSIYRHGNVGINTDEADEALVVHGNLRVTGSVYQPSDIRVKENIEAADTAEQLRTLRNVKLYKYQFKPSFAKIQGRGEDDDNDPQLGVIAQEVNEVVPGSVKTVAKTVVLEDGTTVENLLAVDRDRLFMTNVGATQELGNRVDDMDSEVSDLFDRVEQLEMQQKVDQIPDDQPNECYLQPCSWIRWLTGKGGNTRFPISTRLVIAVLIFLIVAGICGTMVGLLVRLDQRKALEAAAAAAQDYTSVVLPSPSPYSPSASVSPSTPTCVSLAKEAHLPAIDLYDTADILLYIVEQGTYTFGDLTFSDQDTFLMRIAAAPVADGNVTKCGSLPQVRIRRQSDGATAPWTEAPIDPMGVIQNGQVLLTAPLLAPLQALNATHGFVHKNYATFNAYDATYDPRTGWMLHFSSVDWYGGPLKITFSYAYGFV